MTKDIEKARTAAIQKPSVRGLLGNQSFKKQMEELLPKHLTADRMARLALAALTKVPKLADCTTESVFESMMDASLLGLEPDGRRAYLVPYNGQCKLIVGYKGMVSLLMNTGMVSSIHADIIAKNDTFVYDRGEVKKHEIDFTSDRGAMVAAYCIIKMKDGAEKHEVMTLEQVETIRQASPGRNSDAWREHFGEMAKKTVFRRAAKWVAWESTSKPEPAALMQKAIEIDNSQFDFDSKQPPEATETEDGYGK